MSKRTSGRSSRSVRRPASPRRSSRTSTARSGPERTSRMDRVHAGEVALATRVWPGVEPTIVGIHGLTANHTCWYPVAEALAPQHRFIAYDLRGRGGSDKPEHDYNMAAHNRDLLGMLDHFEVERAVVMGHSLGAHLTRYFAYDVEPAPGGGVRSKVAKHAIEEEVWALHRTRLWVWHHQIHVPTLLLRAPDGLLRDDDCLMTQEEAEAMAHAIPDCRLVVVPRTNHYTVVLGQHPVVARALREFLDG